MSDISQDEDERLVKRMLAGHEDAFTDIYARCSGPVYRFALHMTGQASMAEEITQETFVYLLSNGRAFNAVRGSLLSWLLGIARNLSRRASGSFSETEPLDESVEHEPAPATDLLEHFTQRELIDSLWQAIASLPAAYREVVLLCEMQELNYSDAATVLGCPIGTVRSRLHRARGMLVSKLHSRCFV